MFRPAAARSLLRRHVSCSSSPTCSSSTTALLLRRPAASTSRLLSTSAAPKKRSTLKGTAARWALAGAIVYWYTTSAVFADEPKYREERPAGPTEAETDRPASLLPTAPLRRSKASTTRQGEGEGESAALAAHSRAAADELEEEASQEGAFNPETGEINWDCPCLGGMAHGPCGDEFKAAFSCFIFSSEDPKGVDCIERFKDMQTCFQQHPDVYGSELDDDNDNDDDDLDTAGPGPSETGSGRPDQPPTRSTAAAAATSSTSGSAATTGTAPASTGAAPASTGAAPAATGRAPPPEVTERTTAPSLAEPSTSVADTPVLQSAHRGDARARSSSDPPTEREAAVAAEDAPRRRG